MAMKPKLKTLVIPFIIKSLYPTMSLIDYSKVKEDKSFLNQTTFICEECFLCVTMSSECSGVKIILPPEPSVVLAQRKRELSHQAKFSKKENADIDLLNSRTDIKRKDQRAN